MKQDFIVNFSPLSPIDGKITDADGMPLLFKSFSITFVANDWTRAKFTTPEGDVLHAAVAMGTGAVSFTAVRICGFQWFTEHGEPRTCTLALEHHLEGMDEPHQFGAKSPAV